jgi:starch synthase (maltosyl-transferring)
MALTAPGRATPTSTSTDPAAFPPADPLPGDARARFVISEVWPEVEGGRFPAKRTVGERVDIEADLIGDPHHRLAADVLWRAKGEQTWRRAAMHFVDNDRWRGSFVPEALGRHEFTIEAWSDEFAHWRDIVIKKRAAGQSIALELEEARELIGQTLNQATDAERQRLERVLEAIQPEDEPASAALLLDEALIPMMREAAPRYGLTRYRALEIYVNRKAAEYAAWYEMFWRSQGTDPTRGATIDECIGRLGYVRDLGFDTVYFVPIHPIGQTNRKGRNNTLSAGPDDPGSPYAIGLAGAGEHGGGHFDVHPKWGSLEDFRRLVAAARDRGLDVALDFAIQCSPDHPWIKAHPDWFKWRPDGSIKFAENPPKKYEDIVNVEFFDAHDQPIEPLWVELRNVVLFWIRQGVTIFRVDNPHTKPLPFWRWLIEQVQRDHPETIFLAEAFTRPKLMRALAKIGFTQSYSYFTWRNEKQELTDYLVELTNPPVSDYMRANFFVNTPDILPTILQTGGRPAFLQRIVLAATLDSVYGMYNGYELCENEAVPGKEEYLNSEKYQYKVWEWDRLGHIKGWVRQLNRIRAENPALASYTNLAFYTAWNDQILVYGKYTEDRSNFILVAVNLDPHAPQECQFELPLWELGLPDDASVEMEELFSGHRFIWTGKIQHVWIDNQRPAFIWRMTRA